MRITEPKPKTEILLELEAEEKKWLAEIASEQLSGNIVKENYARGVVVGIRIAIQCL